MQVNQIFLHFLWHFYRKEKINLPVQNYIRKYILSFHKKKTFLIAPSPVKYFIASQRPTLSFYKLNLVSRLETIEKN